MNDESKNIKLPENMMLCRWCKEPIMSNDKICKHCNEYQTNKDIVDSEKDLLKDPTLSIFDWITVLFFQLIGILLGYIYKQNGEKKRGDTLILYSILSIFFNTIMSYGIYRFHSFFSKMLKVINTN